MSNPPDPQDSARPQALVALDVPPRTQASIYPEPYASMMKGREKRVLGDRFGLNNFGVNITRLAPGARSALRHAHARQDEFIYVIAGYPTLHTDAGKQRLAPGMCAGFPAGTGDGHCLLNDSEQEVIYLEVGDRSAGDSVSYPDDDLRADFIDGRWQFSHKDGQPW